jgi:hypothetical protein
MELPHLGNFCIWPRSPPLFGLRVTRPKSGEAAWGWVKVGAEFTARRRRLHGSERARLVTLVVDRAGAPAAVPWHSPDRFTGWPLRRELKARSSLEPVGCR